MKKFWMVVPIFVMCLFPANAYAMGGMMTSHTTGGGTAVAAGLRNNHLSGKATATSDQKQFSGGVTLVDAQAGYSMQCDGVTLTQGQGVNIQALISQKNTTDSGGGLRFLGGNNQAVNKNYVYGHAHIGITDPKVFQKLWPAVYAHLLAEPAVNGIHSLSNACGQFTLDDNLIKHNYEVTVTLVTPWDSKPSPVSYAGQYCPTGGSVAGHPSWHTEIGNLNGGTQTSATTWHEQLALSGNQLDYNLVASCAGVYRVQVKDIKTGKVVQDRPWDVYPNMLVIPSPTPPPPSQQSGGNLWISK